MILAECKFNNILEQHRFYKVRKCSSWWWFNEQEMTLVIRKPQNILLEKILLSLVEQKQSQKSCEEVFACAIVKKTAVWLYAGIKSFSDTDKIFSYQVLIGKFIHAISPSFIHIYSNCFFLCYKQDFILWHYSLHNTVNYSIDFIIYMVFIKSLNISYSS